MSVRLLRGRARRQRTRREELTEARDQVQRQLEILIGGPAGGDVAARRSDTDYLYDQLTETLSELEVCLAELNSVGPESITRT